MGKVKYPNPKFFKAKDKMDWAAQAENLKLVGGIFWEMFKETDWKKFGEGWKNILVSDRDRIKEEYKAFAAASAKDKIDLILNGEVTSAACIVTAPCAPCVVSGAASRTRSMTSMNGLVCGACCSCPSPRT